MPPGVAPGSIAIQTSAASQPQTITIPAAGLGNVFMVILKTFYLLRKKMYFINGITKSTFNFITIIRIFFLIININCRF